MRDICNHLKFLVGFCTSLVLAMGGLRLLVDLQSFLDLGSVYTRVVFTVVVLVVTGYWSVRALLWGSSWIVFGDRADLLRSF